MRVIGNPKQMDMSWKLTVKIGLCVIAGDVFRKFLLRRVDCFKSRIKNKMTCRIFVKLHFPAIRIFMRNLKTQKYTEYLENP